mgnify:CR=1 FL=1
MSNDAFESCMFLKLDGGSMKMIEALQTHLALEYDFFETPADIVESAIFEMYTRMVICEVSNYNSTFAAQNRQVHLNIIGQTRKPLL